MDNLTAAILTLIIISPSIILLAVIVYREIRKLWIWTAPVRVRTRALARQLSGESQKLAVMTIRSANVSGNRDAASTQGTAQFTDLFVR